MIRKNRRPARARRPRQPPPSPAYLVPTFTYVSPTEVRADFDQPAVYRGTIPNWRINGHPTLFVVGAALGNAQGALITWNGPLAVGYEINVLFGSNSFKAAASGGLTKPGRYVIGA